MAKESEDKEQETLPRKKIDGRCEFLYGRLCHLQTVNMKPFSCKIWPFRVLLKPDKMDKTFDGLYQTHNKEYFVYLNPTCSGINKGNPVDLARTVREVIELSTGSKRKQYYSTYRELDFGRLLSTPRVKRVWDQVLLRGRVDLDLPVHSQAISVRDQRLEVRSSVPLTGPKESQLVCTIIEK